MSPNVLSTWCPCRRPSLDNAVLAFLPNEISIVVPPFRLIAPLPRARDTADQAA